MKRISILAAACALVMTAMPATARVVTMTAQSSAFSGNDLSNFFGVGPSLAGQAAYLTLTYDTAAAPVGVGGQFTDPNAFSGMPTWLGLSLTVAGNTFTYNNGPIGFSIVDLQLTENGTEDVMYLNWSRATFPAPVLGVSNFAGSLGLRLGGDLFNTVATLPELDGTYVFTPNESSAGFYVRDLICGLDCMPLEFDGFLQLDAGTFSTPAPEPAALGLFGLGLVGLTLRRRRRV